MYTKEQCEIAMENANGFLDEVEKGYKTSGKYDEWMYNKLMGFFGKMAKDAVRNYEKACA